ncbi:MAG TPA: hypothetical protein VFZ41_02150 [Solirubrobacterales bacterium]
MTRHDEDQLAKALESLPPAPSAWVEAAKELPRMRSEIDGIVERATHDAAYRRAVIKAMESSLAETSDESERRSLDELRERLSAAEDSSQDDR